MENNSQSDIFLSEEANSWFMRNKKVLKHGYELSSIQFIKQTLRPFRNEINSILEIGCSNAIKLETLVDDFAAKGYGLDPSTLAIDDGKERISRTELDIELSVGISFDLPFQNNSMDAVYLGFFLYVVDRNDLAKSISEADRVLRPGGFLIIEDFDYGKPVTREYSHHSMVKTFKDDYSKYFVERFNYHLVEKHSYSHEFDNFDIRENERLATQILYKPKTLVEL